MFCHNCSRAYKKIIMNYKIIKYFTNVNSTIKLGPNKLLRFKAATFSCEKTLTTPIITVYVGYGITKLGRSALVANTPPSHIFNFDVRCYLHKSKTK